MKQRKQIHVIIKTQLFYNVDGRRNYTSINLRLLLEKSKNDIRYCVKKENFNWKLKTKTEVWGDDFYRAF